MVRVIKPGFSGGSVVKSPLALQEPQEMQFRSLSQEDPLEEEMATHSHILVWETHGHRSLAGYPINSQATQVFNLWIRKRVKLKLGKIITMKQ